MGECNPLCIAELVEACMDHVNTPGDLAACALVSRLWVHPAQSRLFRAPYITEWHRFLNMLATSRHLIPHIRQLRIRPEDVATLARICAVPFTHLQSTVVILSGDYLPCGSVAALQQLFRLPTLRRVELHCFLNNEGEFASIWDQCAPNIKDITLNCRVDHPLLGIDVDPLRPATPSPGGILLQSLRMHSPQMLDSTLIRQNSHPFNLSKLKFLSIGWRAHVPWPNFAPVVRSIEGLDIVVNASAASLDLSAFPNLTFLRISLPFWIPPERRLAMLDQLFSTLSPANILETLVICPSNGVVQMDGMLCMTLDAKLSSGPFSPTLAVELEVEQTVYGGIWPFFSTLNARNSLGRTEGRVSWW
ncbi:hypothetical protein MSAN_01233100 [Mycena sanguinolenta]|uniref:F-box domain-containing protein n=1 Tax=Mycena sanguinolenta TaxID=230812 RepID=A0A8H6YI14_9AGAR|nr:hypothetical protein MSAN_01233100 [Mycena sanguinolenta]